MPQLKIHVNKETAATLKRRAKAQGVSVPKYIASVLDKDSVQDWPADYFEKVLGAWQGEPLERLEQGEFEDREGLA